MPSRGGALRPACPPPSPKLEQTLVIHAECHTSLQVFPWYVHLRPATIDYDKVMRPPAAVWLYLYNPGSLHVGRPRPKAVSACSGSLTALNFTERHPQHRGITADWRDANYVIEPNNGIPRLTGPKPHAGAPSQGVFRVDASESPETVWLTESPRPQFEREVGPPRVSRIDPEFREFFTKRSLTIGGLLHQEYRRIRTVARLPRKEVGGTEVADLFSCLCLPAQASLLIDEAIQEKDIFTFIYRARYRA